MKPSMTAIKPRTTENQYLVKNLQENIIKQSKEVLGNENISESFVKSITQAIDDVSSNQMKSAELTKKFELGIENDLTKVMIQQQLAGLGFQMTLNVRNKVLSAYKDIMNMPV